MLKLKAMLISIIALSSLPLMVGVNGVRGEEGTESWKQKGIVSREVAVEGQDYCHIKYMAFNVNTLGYSTPEFEPGDLVDFYGSCSFDPTSKEEIQKQVAEARDGLKGDGSSDSD